MKTYLCFDISNVMHRCFFASGGADEETTAGMAHHMALTTMNKYFKQHTPDKVVMAFDKSSWRKDYTKSDVCYSKRIYKGERRKDMTEGQKAHYNVFLGHVKDFEVMIKEHTSVVTLSDDGLEADDLIAGVVQAFSHDTKIIIISSDKDYMQLLSYPNVTLIDPASDKPRTLEEWNNDAKLFLFEKCFRGEKGDSSDNIESAYPRLRKNKIEEAYTDEYKRQELFHHKWKHVDGREMEVIKLFNENKLLMDLSAQPDEIKDKIANEIIRAFSANKKFSYFNFMQFCGKYKLEKILDNYKNYMKMLSL